MLNFLNIIYAAVICTPATQRFLLLLIAVFYYCDCSLLVKNLQYVVIDHVFTFL